jgi:hypothetical protein
VYPWRIVGETERAMHGRKPRAVIQCVDSAAVAAGRDGGLDLAIRGGDHIQFFGVTHFS